MNIFLWLFEGVSADRIGEVQHSLWPNGSPSDPCHLSPCSNGRSTAGDIRPVLQRNSPEAPHHPPFTR
jgi:hypothetical protein